MSEPIVEALELPYGTIVGDGATVHADGSDVNPHPDVSAFEGVRVTFTPSDGTGKRVNTVIWTGADGPTILHPQVETGRFEGGRLVLDVPTPPDPDGLRLMATVSDDMVPNSWGWKMEWTGWPSGKGPGPVIFPLEPGATVDLAEALAGYLPQVPAVDFANLLAAADEVLSVRDETVGIRNETAVIRDEVEVISGLTGEDEAVGYLVRSSTSATRAALEGLRGAALTMPPVTSVEVEDGESSPIPIARLHGYIWGNIGTQLYRSADDGQTWQSFAQLGDWPRVIQATDDGEVLVACTTRILKSSGWDEGAGTGATFEQKIARNGQATFLPWSLAGDGTRFITTEYTNSPRSDSRYVRRTLDAGETWDVVYDSNTLHGAAGVASHLHGCAYDPWHDRWYISEGHNRAGTSDDIAGIYYCDDIGVVTPVWTRAPGMVMDPSPTVLIPTPEGLVCGSDSTPNGIFGVRHESDGSREQLRQVWDWAHSQNGLIGFANSGFYDEQSGQAIMAWTTAFSNVAPIITAGTVETGSKIWEWPTLPVANSDTLSQPVPTSGGGLLVTARTLGAHHRVKMRMGTPSAPSASREDTGRVFGGAIEVGVGSSMAVGRGASAAGQRSVTIGPLASAAGNQNQVAVGYESVTESNAVAVGTEAEAGSSSVVVGRSSTAGSEAVVVGSNATVTAGQAVAIGRNAEVSHARSVALGHGSVSSATRQVNIGDRHLEVLPIAGDPAQPTDGAARIYTVVNEGKTELRVRFPSGNSVVLAGES